MVTASEGRETVLVVSVLMESNTRPCIQMRLQMFNVKNMFYWAPYIITAPAPIVKEICSFYFSYELLLLASIIYFLDYISL